MKTITLKLAGLLLVFFNCGQSSQAQRYVNQDWSSIVGLPIDIHWSSSMIASTGHIITVGNTYTSGQSANVLLTKYAPDGAIVWQVEYDNPDNLEDYGIALCEDNSGNFYVAGTSFRSSSASLDLTVLKFDASGTNSWAYYFDGTASGDDIPAEIVTDGTDVFVTGGTENTSTGTDYITIKVKNDGSEVWTNFYDHNSYADAAIEIDINQNGEIIVAGGSADQANLYDMATVKYDPNGNLINIHRSNYNVGIDQPTSFDIDTSGNTIIGGYYIPSTSEMQISLVSLNDTLGLNWSVLHDPSAGEDKIIGLVTDASGNIYVTGHTEETPNYFKCYTAKFSNTGNLIWERDYQSPEGGAFGKSIKLGTSGEIYVAGMNYNDGNDTNIITLVYREDGKLITSKEYNAGGTEILSNLELDYWGNIYLHGTSSVNGNGYVTLKYSTYQRDFDVSTNAAYNVEYIDNEIIVQFKPIATNPVPFFDRGKTYGQLSDFVTSGAIDALNTEFENAHNWGRFNAMKVFKRLTPDDTASITRLGDTILLHHFWSTLIVEVPASIDEFAASSVLNSLDEFIYNCEPNLVGTTTDIPNDSGFVAGSQEGLESNNTPENDVEMDRAWNIYKGSSFSRVGIFDSGIDFNHEDFSKTGQLTYSDSKIAGGFDYWNNSAVPSGYGDDHGHGTRTAGIAGAIRNNDLGVASVAGGDADSNNFGCDLVDFRIFNNSGGFGGLQTSVDKAAEAMVEGAMDWNEGGYALTVLNNSWRIVPGTALDNMGNKTLMFKTNQSVYNNGAVNVCGRGNENNAVEVIPANAGPDHFMIAVGASGIDGKKSASSSFGGNLDIIAPGVSELVYSTDTYEGPVQNRYFTHNGTSAAAPHVAGVAALLTGQANDPARWVPNSLAPEDVENLIQLYPSDVDTTGYDVNTGWGRLNAGSVMEHMEWPYYWVQHYEETAYEILVSLSDIHYNATVHIKEDFDYAGTAYDVPEGTYKAHIYPIEVTGSHNIGSAQLLNGWIRNGSAHSNLLSNDSNNLYNIPSAVLDSVDNTTAYIHGYQYKIVSDAQNNPVNKFLPPDSLAPKFAYSLHLLDTNATGFKEKQTKSNSYSQLRVWPNPSGNEQIVLIPMGNNQTVTLIDMQGRALKQVFNGSNNQEQMIKVNISDLSPGVYFYQLKSGDQTLTTKFIKL